MTIEQQVLEKATRLSSWNLKQKNGRKKPLRSLRGLWKDLNIHITEEDIAEVFARRKEAFGVGLCPDWWARSSRYTRIYSGATV